MSAKDLVVIASPGLSAGFELAGVSVLEAMDATEAASHIDRLIDDPNAGVIMIEDGLYRTLPEEPRRSLERSSVPVVIPIPGPDWTEQSTAHEYIVDILRRAIGYRVRLQ